MRPSKQTSPSIESNAVRICRLCGKPIYDNLFVWAKKKTKKGNSYTFAHEYCYKNLCPKKEEKA